LKKIEKENEDFLETAAGKPTPGANEKDHLEEKDAPEPKDKENVLFPRPNIPIPLKINITKT
jgi:hypothetical protein